jgi:hypothetical protein
MDFKNGSSIILNRPGLVCRPGALVIAFPKTKVYGLGS